MAFSFLELEQLLLENRFNKNIFITFIMTVGANITAVNKTSR